MINQEKYDLAGNKLMAAIKLCQEAETLLMELRNENALVEKCELMFHWSARMAEIAGEQLRVGLRMMSDGHPDDD